MKAKKSSRGWIYLAGAAALSFIGYRYWLVERKYWWTTVSLTTPSGVRQYGVKMSKQGQYDFRSTRVPGNTFSIGPQGTRYNIAEAADFALMLSDISSHYQSFGLSAMMLPSITQIATQSRNRALSR